MTAKESRSKGLAYDANYGLEIIKELRECKDACYDYNMLRPSDESRNKK